MECEGWTLYFVALVCRIDVDVAKFETATVGILHPIHLRLFTETTSAHLLPTLYSITKLPLEGERLRTGSELCSFTIAVAVALTVQELSSSTS